MGKVALVFGASGVTGWSFVNEILTDYPKPGVWEKVHALTNRPLKQEDSLWPADSRLNIVSGIDLLKGTQEELEAEIKREIPDVDKVTHVYYLAYKASKDRDQELKDAVDMWRRSATALDHLSPALEFQVLQTGAKMYGCHLLENHPTDYIQVPLKESFPRLRQPYHDQLFYHPQLDWVTSYAKDKKWNWIDTRPDIIIGFVPNQNFYSLATSTAVFLSLYAAVNGPGATVPYPGSRKAWVAKSIDSSSDMIARQTLHLTLTLGPEHKGEGYNVADAKYPSSWEQKWPALAGYFGLKGVAPPEKAEEQLEVRAYIKEHWKTWEELERNHGLKTGIADSPMTYAGFEYFLFTQFDFDRQYDMTKMYSTGFTEERTTIEAWGPVFDRLKKAKIIPS
ncbi:hypothetical protein EJ06DRAFT_526590 [Trichodelitschia bisporula]|uniref:PRISE-like Rossmann-fold domain-containing protein n=1 Tax=Trichodelitschia bisporula TaxID=703511 RepID=A0A6G1I8R1_9PEZI|nr:hypothetical protein EJ06DRAFT_526590 [Trichodelitschia bisporula]